MTVLDFIGEANRRFRFDLRYRAVTGATRTEVVKQTATQEDHAAIEQPSVFTAAPATV